MIPQNLGLSFLSRTAALGVSFGLVACALGLVLGLCFADEFLVSGEARDQAPVWPHRCRGCGGVTPLPGPSLEGSAHVPPPPPHVSGTVARCSPHFS